MSASIWDITVEGGFPPIDGGEVRRALGLLVGPGATHEIRALRPERSCLVRGDDIEAAVKAVERFVGSEGIYVTLNPVRPDLTGSANAKDVVRRRNLLIDCDRRANKDQSATDEEKEAAHAVAESVQAALTARGWPRPIVLDSGNGFHLVYAIDLPNDNLVKVAIEKFLKAVHEEHSTDLAEVDTKVHDAPRITKLSGTWARKGQNTPDRPHRMAVLKSVPHDYTTAPRVAFEQIQAVAGIGPKPKRFEPKNAWEMPVIRSGEDRSGYARKALEGQCGEVEREPEGNRNCRLNRAAFRIGQLLHLGLARKEAEQSLFEAARTCGLDEAGSRKTIASGLDAGKLYPKEPKAKPEGKAPQPAPDYSPDADGDEDESTVGKSGKTYAFPLIIKGSSVVPEKIDWLWENRIPYGFLTLFAGRTSVGKSFVTIDIVSRLSTGGPIPQESGLCFERQSSLIISEDSHNHILAPRLIESGADMDRVNFMTWRAMAEYTLANTGMLDDAYHAAGQPRLIVIDPPTNFLGGKDEHKNAEVRSVLMGVSIWAMSYGAACVMITHCNKDVKKETAALDRVIGSVAWASTSRIAHLMSPHPEDRLQRVFLCLKSNIGEMPVGLTYQIKKTEALAVVDWTGTIDLHADDAISGEKKKPRGVVAVEWLAERFREKREWLSDDIVRAGAEAGVSRSALFSPEAAALPITKRQNVHADGSRHWSWIAQPGWPPEIARNSEILKLCEPKPKEDNTHNRVSKREGSRDGETEGQSFRVSEFQGESGETVIETTPAKKRTKKPKVDGEALAEAVRFLTEALSGGAVNRVHVAAAVAFHGGLDWKVVEGAAEFMSLRTEVRDGQLFWSLSL